MPAPKGNQYTRKIPKGKEDSLNMRCHQDDKQSWKEAAEKAGASNLSEWVVFELNKAAEATSKSKSI